MLKNCSVCARPFDAVPYGKTLATRKTCSTECMREAARQAGAKGGSPSHHPRASKMTRVCEVCGECYRYTYAKQRTCSRACGTKISTTWSAENRAKRADREPRRTRWPQCAVHFISCCECGELFTSPNTRRSICSDACATSRKLRAGRQYNKTRPKRPAIAKPPKRPVRFIAGPCRRCGTQFVSPNWGSTPDTYCSRLCQKRAERSRLSHVRRARKRNAEVVESFDLREIADRDRCRCGLCGRKVDMTLLVPDPMAPTLDHVIPLAKGGDHSRANAQLAHFICNSIKGDRGEPQQLALIG